MGRAGDRILLADDLPIGNADDAEKAYAGLPWVL